MAKAVASQSPLMAPTGTNVPSASQSSAMTRLKDTIRKLPMFETYQDDEGEYDFEWPTRAHLKTMTNAK